MTQKDINQIRIEAYKVDETDSAVVIIRIKNDGKIRVVNCGEPDASKFAYELVCKVWKDFNKDKNGAFGFYAFHKIGQ